MCYAYPPTPSFLPTTSITMYVLSSDLLLLVRLRVLSFPFCFRGQVPKIRSLRPRSHLQKFPLKSHLYTHSPAMLLVCVTRWWGRERCTEKKDRVETTNIFNVFPTTNPYHFLPFSVLYLLCFSPSVSVFPCMSLLSYNVLCSVASLFVMLLEMIGLLGGDDTSAQILYNVFIKVSILYVYPFYLPSTTHYWIILPCLSFGYLFVYDE